MYNGNVICIMGIEYVQWKYYRTRNGNITEHIMGIMEMYTFPTMEIVP